VRPVPGSVYEVVRQFTVQSGKTYDPETKALERKADE
jgi:hypothetical protein